MAEGQPLHPSSPCWSSRPAASRSSPPGHLCRSAQPAIPGGAQDPEASSRKPLAGAVPPSWKDLSGGWSRPGAEPCPLACAPGFQDPPPVCPVGKGPPGTDVDGADGSGSSGRTDEEDDCKKPPSDATPPSTSGETMAPPSQGGAWGDPPGNKEKLEAYGRKYAHLRSWPGLLRLLAGLELILGGVVFACTAAYIQKDYQWSQLSGSGFLPYSSLAEIGYNYYGPMTPFVLVVASLAWLVTVILLGLGVTTYYQAILLSSHWWPLAEFALNLLMFLLYLAAALAYVNDVSRGGLCYSAFAYNPLITALCRVDGGQVAAVTFLFLTPLLYLTGSLVSLKMWRHEAVRRMLVRQPEEPLLPPGASEHRVPRGEARPARRLSKHVAFSEKGGPEVLNSAAPMGHNPKPLLVPDYIARYPAITSLDERGKYTAIFSDQYSEYRELFREIRAAQQKFKELDTLMCKLPARPQDKEERSRVSAVWSQYRSKKEDPAFLEKRERCQYLRQKLSHLKAQIQAFDSGAGEPSAFF